MIYNILKSDFRCKYLDSCLNMFPLHVPEFFKLLNEDDTIYSFITKPVYAFCLSQENHTKCARYKIKEEGGDPLPGVSPTGETVNIEDSIAQRKISLNQTQDRIV